MTFRRMYVHRALVISLFLLINLFFSLSPKSAEKYVRVLWRQVAEYYYRSIFRKRINTSR
jgi:hypothetical protein